MYGVGGIPHVQIAGTAQVVGGGGNIYPSYLNIYNQKITYNSPLEINLDFGLNDSGNMAIMADIEVTGDITTSNNKVVYVVTRELNDDYFSSVVLYENEPFTLTEIGQTQHFEHEVTFEDDWDISELKAIIMVQSFNPSPGNTQKQILQAGITGYSGVLPLFDADILSGPPALKVTFTSHSFPLNGIDFVEWDFNNDGVYDSAGDVTTNLFTEVGSYDVKMKITVDGEAYELLTEDYITVTEPSDVSGVVNGVWSADYSPYHINGDINIPIGSELEISEGTELILQENVNIVCNGKLIIQGSENNNVTISGNSWGSILISNSVEDNIIEYATFTGSQNGVLKVDYANIDISHCRFLANNSTANPAAISLNGSEVASITNSIFKGNNSTLSTGGVSILSSNVIFKNNLIANNVGKNGAAMIIKSSDNVEVINNTIFNNEDIGNSNFQVFVFNSTPVIMNTIIWGENSPFMNINSTLDISYSCINEDFGETNLNEDPLFADVENNIFSLSENSPCIDAGNPDDMYNDVEDTNNPGYALYPSMGTILNDIGAYGGGGHLIWVENHEEIINPLISNMDVYPNPFNPTCTISYDLPHNANVNLSIYNLKGQKVKTLINQNQTSGNHKVVWNGRDENGNAVSSGVYFFRVNHDNNVQLKKAILLK